MRNRLHLQNIKRLGLLMLALPVISLGIGFFNLAGFGTDPFTCMNQSLAALVGRSFGLTQLVINGLLLAVVLLLARYLIGIATLANMVLIGFYVDWLAPLLHRLFPEQPGMAGRVAMMLCGVVVVSLGGAVYTKTRLGVSPYDAVGFSLAQRSGIKFAWCRIATDAAVTAAGFLMGGVVGAGTVVTAFCMGPLIGFFNVHVCDRLLHMDEFDDPILAAAAEEAAAENAAAEEAPASLPAPLETAIP